MSNFSLPPGLRPAPGPSGSSSPGPMSGGQAQGPSDEEREAARERAEQQEETKRTMIAAMLEPEARERRESQSNLGLLVPCGRLDGKQRPTEGPGGQ